MQDVKDCNKILYALWALVSHKLNPSRQKKKEGRVSPARVYATISSPLYEMVDWMSPSSNAV